MARRLVYSVISCAPCKTYEVLERYCIHSKTDPVDHVRKKNAFGTQGFWERDVRGGVVPGMYENACIGEGGGHEQNDYEI